MFTVVMNDGAHLSPQIVTTQSSVIIKEMRGCRLYSLSSIVKQETPLPEDRSEWGCCRLQETTAPNSHFHKMCVNFKVPSAA